jgi:D-alanyl-D-alanine endopeptidase (penicillin-binding protein 7)
MPWLLAMLFAVALSFAPVSSSQAAAKGATAKKAVAAKPGKAVRQQKTVVSKRLSKKGPRRVVRAAPPVPSYGQLYGLRSTEDELDLKSSVALVVDQDTNEVLFSKNPGAVLPIASITKLMTALVVTEASLPLDEVLEVSPDDVAATAGSRSRLALGTQLTRGEMLHLSLMASENRAAHVLGRTYPGGMDRFVRDMNIKARFLGMGDTKYVEPTGLSSSNQSSAQDLTRLVRAAFEHPIIRDLSTSLEAAMPVGAKTVQFRNTNGLIRNPDWEIGLQKTGYIAAAGRCVVMQTQMAGRKLILVLLDSAGKYTRIGDAERLRDWMARTSLLPDLRPKAAAGAAAQPR